MVKLIYIIHCERMRRPHEIEVKSHVELIEALNRYAERFGPIIMLYQVDRIQS